MFRYRLEKLIEQSGKTQNAICQELGVSKQKLSKWKTGYNEPSIIEIVLIAVYFEVSTDYLVGLENEDGTKRKMVIVRHGAGNIAVDDEKNVIIGYIRNEDEYY